MKKFQEVVHWTCVCLTVVVFCCAQLLVAQQIESLEIPDQPLVLESMGSFYMGGQKEFQTVDELGGFSSEGKVTVNQMYVAYWKPAENVQSTNFVFIHGMNLSGKTWETTPDGRMGWNEYFVRRGYPVYVVDQVGAGRSGFNQKKYNLAKLGKLDAAEQESFQLISDDNVWINFRFGTGDGQPVTAAKFPVMAADELSKQSIPFALFGLPNPNPNYTNLAQLALKLENTVLVSHSQSGAFPVEAALIEPRGIEAMVLLEPGGTAANFTDEQINTLVDIPLLVVFGDNLENETGIPGHSWKNYFDGWGSFVEKLNQAGGKAKMMYLPEEGISGNSHMLMQDINNEEIAELVLEWLKEVK